MAFLFKLFTALADIKEIAGYLEEFAGAVTLWYLQRQKNETLSQIADAAALAARAQTQEERLKATDAWHAVLSRPRVSR